MSEPLPNPTAGELDCLSALWQAVEEGVPALKLSDIRERIAQRRGELGEPEPALTTVSTYLRSAVMKKLLDEVRIDEEGKAVDVPAIRARGALIATRSPRTAYKPTHEPGAVFDQTFRAIKGAYPIAKQKIHPLIDMARSMALPAKVVKDLEKWLQDRLANE